MPALPTFANQETPSAPSQRRKVARPRSIVRTVPESATSIARSGLCGMPSERAKSQPVPRGITAISTPSRCAIPFTTSCTEPSPPTTTSRSAPSSAARRASSVSSPAAREKRTSPLRPAAAARCEISGQRLPVEPLADAGLTRKTVFSASVLLVGRDRRERDARHPVDRSAELVVRDALELTLDDDVADGQQAAGLHSAQRADGEERGGLHLDGEHSTLRPAL